ncbi:uncharacterized protein [Chlorocebus sabaeus]|uniref:uncharacterized protein isoform X1 n=1 Tax=Chlorocebus sabaeus TaxID=60711 RepID=UPI003BFA1932
MKPHFLKINISELSLWVIQGCFWLFGTVILKYLTSKIFGIADDFLWKKWRKNTGRREEEMKTEASSTPILPALHCLHCSPGTYSVLRRVTSPHLQQPLTPPPAGSLLAQGLHPLFLPLCCPSTWSCHPGLTGLCPSQRSGLTLPLSLECKWHDHSSL